VDKFFLDSPSGAGRVAWDIAQLMQERGHKATIFCCKQKPEDEEISRYENVDIVRFQIPQTFSLDPFKVQKQIRAGIRVAEEHLTNTNWDVVHIHLPVQGNIVYELFGPAVRYVYTVHSPAVLESEINWLSGGIAGKIKWMFGQSLLRKYEGELLQKANKIHTLSNFTKNSIDSFYGVGSKITVIPHWCRKDFFRQYNKQDARKILNWHKDSKIIFSVRRLAPRMGLDIAIKALAPLLKVYPRVIFVLAGAGSLEEYLKQLAQSLGVTEKVWFLGRVSDETLKRCYEAADLFILPTRSLECFGLPVLEALAYGLPVISTDAAALPELMGPILPNCIVPAGSVESLTEKIMMYLENKLELPESEKLVGYVKEWYGFEVVSHQMVEFLES
jgi:glycosyltransferase involved in cell wall biosynthesis